eukprot:TCONS_00013089-protein
MEKLKVLSLNCWGLRFLSKDLDQRMAALGDLLAKSDYDIIGLQEVWVEEHYLSIKEKIKNILPYSHRFISNGFISTGCVTFSKYPIIDTLFQRYLFNGYFYDYNHGDWYAGKGITGVIIKHPKKDIYFFNTHMHANYDYQNAKFHFNECRTLQAYQAAQFVKHVTRPSDPIIFSGDFNHESHELGMRGLKELISLRDTHDVCEKKCGDLATVDCESNHYLEPTEAAKRIDFIFCNDFFTCDESKLACRQIPNSKMHYSDHEGYEVELTFHHDKESVDHSKMEDYKSMGLLSKIHDCMKEGERISGELSWVLIITLAIAFSLVVGLPACYAGLDMFAHPSTIWASVVFFCQLIIVVFCAIYLWVVLSLRKCEMHTFKGIAQEIEIKMKQLVSSNGKKSD